MPGSMAYPPLVIERPVRFLRRPTFSRTTRAGTEAPPRVKGGDDNRELGQIESLVNPGEGRLHAPPSQPRLRGPRGDAHRVDSGHHTILTQEMYPMSDNTDVRQRSLLFGPRKRRGLGLPVYVEHPHGLDAGRHLARCGLGPYGSPARRWRRSRFQAGRAAIVLRWPLLMLQPSGLRRSWSPKVRPPLRPLPGKGPLQ